MDETPIEEKLDAMEVDDDINSDGDPDDIGSSVQIVGGQFHPSKELDFSEPGNVFFARLET